MAGCIGQILLLYQKKIRNHFSLSRDWKNPKIVVQNDEIAFIVSHFNSLFDKHFHAFELHEEKPPLRALFLFNKIPDCEPLSIVTSYKWNGISYVNPRNIV